MIDLKTYEARIEDLFSRHASVSSAGFSSISYKPGLDAQRKFDRALGSPSTAFRSIHVAGTNGKGSVCSFLASVLAGSGHRVGLYTSPHLLDFRERIKVISTDSDSPHISSGKDLSCEMITREGVIEFLDRYDPDMDSLTFFEVTTGMAFWWFARQKVDIAVIETGLGGLLDSTNIIVPEVSVVTSIGLDHCALLGNTRAEIAVQKAGILKPGVPAVVGTRDEQTAPVFEARASELGCRVCYGEDFRFDACALDLDLKGPCQDINVRTALTALSLLKDSASFFRKPGPSSSACQELLPSCRQALENAAANTRFHGRWEYVRGNVICDIGHNPPALKENFSRLVSLGRPMIIVYGIMADKDLDGIAPLMPSGARYILTAPATPRALPASELSARLSALRPDLDLRPASDVRSAVSMALAMSKSLESGTPCTSDPIIYIGGSTYVVSEAMKALDFA